jgi:carboxypeptidase C (cathepsin A)
VFLLSSIVGLSFLARSNVCHPDLFHLFNSNWPTELGLNLYDVRRTCDRQKDGPLCYKGLEWVEAWMNDATIKKELGVNPSLTFQSCNMRVNQDFTAQADGMRNSALLLTDLVNEGVRLLVYAGNAGMRLIIAWFVGVR